MKRRCNQRHDLRTRKRTFNPKFWEVPIEHEVLRQFSEERRLWHETPSEVELRHRDRDRALELMPLIRRLIAEVLTERQREIVQLYFFEQKTQQEVAKLLGISVSSVSQHLFGKRRANKVVGGAIPRLRRELIRSGLAGKIVGR